MSEKKMHFRVTQFEELKVCKNQSGKLGGLGVGSSVIRGVGSPLNLLRVFSV